MPKASALTHLYALACAQRLQQCRLAAEPELVIGAGSAIHGVLQMDQPRAAREDSASLTAFNVATPGLVMCPLTNLESQE